MFLPTGTYERSERAIPLLYKSGMCIKLTVLHRHTSTARHIAWSAVTMHCLACPVWWQPVPRMPPHIEGKRCLLCNSGVLAADTVWQALPASSTVWWSKSDMHKYPFWAARSWICSCFFPSNKTAAGLRRCCMQHSECTMWLDAGADQLHISGSYVSGRNVCACLTACVLSQQPEALLITQNICMHCFVCY